MNDILRTERTAMASDAPVEKSGSHSQRAAFAAIDTLRHKALEKLTLAIAKAVESASDDTLADIVGSEDLRHALVIAPRDIAPQDRKSVVSGKSVSVRVDLGGRRYMKKKNKT